MVMKPYHRQFTDVYGHLLQVMGEDLGLHKEEFWYLSIEFWRKELSAWLNLYEQMLNGDNRAWRSFTARYNEFKEKGEVEYFTDIKALAEEV